MRAFTTSTTLTATRCHPAGCLDARWYVYTDYKCVHNAACKEATKLSQKQRRHTMAWRGPRRILEVASVTSSFIKNSSAAATTLCTIFVCMPL